MQNAAPLELVVALIRAGAPPQPSHPSTPPREISTRAWDALLPFARQHGLSGLLYKAIQTLNRTDAPDNLRAALRETFLNTHLTQRLAYQELGALLDACAHAEIPILVLKGAALARTWYPDPALRPFGDLDLLVHERDHARASEILTAREYAAATEMSEGADSAMWGQQSFFRGGNHPARVELHWHLFVSSYYRRRVSLEWFWQHCETFDARGHAAQMFDATAQLLYLSAHNALHHRDARFIWLYDLALLLAQRADELDWTRALETAHTFGLARAVRYSLLAASQVWNVPLPAPAQRALENMHTDLSERVMFTLTRSRYREARWLTEGIGSGGTQFWTAHLFPSPAYMRERYRIRHDVLLPLHYAARLGLGGLKFLRAAFALILDTKKK